MVMFFIIFRLIQDVSRSSLNVCGGYVTKTKIYAIWGQTLHLGCYAKLPYTFSSEDVVWYHYSKEKGRQELQFQSDKYIETSQHGLVILSAQQEDSGQYDCFVGTSLLCSYEVNIDFDRCLSPNQNENYQKIYADWCREFEKYKQSRKTWEKKEAVSY
ncbi:semaphorin-2A-like [Agrilus planipennis]|uniref:Semaphorin-2A-like n=1 Tax=Agrilus planipennis TaxID=224129 RepID=A0A7F5R861_AGRPL|nr:semaphorin-2A-like [Agrilus planipennis]